MTSPICTVMMAGRLHHNELAVLGIEPLALDEGVIVLVGKVHALQAAGALMYRTVALIEAHVGGAPDPQATLQPDPFAPLATRPPGCDAVAHVADESTFPVVVPQAIKHDRRQPPPGYYVREGGFGYVFDDPTGDTHTRRRGCASTTWRHDDALARAWAHYDARHPREDGVS